MHRIRSGEGRSNSTFAINRFAFGRNTRNNGSSCSATVCAKNHQLLPTECSFARSRHRLEWASDTSGVRSDFPTSIDRAAHPCRRSRTICKECARANGKRKWFLAYEKLSFESAKKKMWTPSSHESVGRVHTHTLTHDPIRKKDEPKWEAHSNVVQDNHASGQYINSLVVVVVFMRWKRITHKTHKIIEKYRAMEPVFFVRLSSRSKRSQI